jgi:hypothetical protein
MRIPGCMKTASAYIHAYVNFEPSRTVSSTCVDFDTRYVYSPPRFASQSGIAHVTMKCDSTRALTIVLDREDTTWSAVWSMLLRSHEWHYTTAPSAMTSVSRCTSCTPPLTAEGICLTNMRHLAARGSSAATTAHKHTTTWYMQSVSMHGHLQAAYGADVRLRICRNMQCHI